MPDAQDDQRGRGAPRRTQGQGERGPEGPGGPGQGPGPGGGGGGGSGQQPLRPSRGLFGLLMFLTIGFVAFLLLAQMSSTAMKIDWAEFEDRWQKQQIDRDSVVIRDTGVFAKLTGGATRAEANAEVYIPAARESREDTVREVRRITGGKFTEAVSSIWQQMLPSLIVTVAIILLIWFLISRAFRSAAAGGGGMLGNFGKSRHKVLMKEKTGVTFDDVAGIDEAKDEVEEIIQFLKNPRRFMRLGGRIPRGVLLVGEPGCGKTLLAKAIAGEADVPFFSISGSDFVEMFVGVGASRVRDLFKQAKENAPCIIFLDEIDAVGRRRGGGFTTGGHDEREQTLNAILVEMDGFTPSDGVIVIAATNRSDVLDPALIRPGRFDRQIMVSLPDVKGRLEILRVHAKRVKLGPNCDLERLARATPMFSGADLAAIINEAAIGATLQNKDWIEQDDLEEARDKVKFGRAKKSRVRESEENKLTAYHEAGHAILQALLKDADPLHKVTIIPRGQTGGATFSLPEKDRSGYGVKWLKATMRVACGGRIAEQKAMGDISSGASMDIAQVTRIARTMVEEWGMSDKLGFIRYAASDTREMFIPEKNYSDDTAKLIDEEVRRLVDEAYKDAERMLDENWDKVERVADALLKYETLDAADVMRLMRGEVLTRPTVSEMVAAEARKPKNPPAAPPATTGEADLPPGTLPRPA